MRCLLITFLLLLHAILRAQDRPGDNLMFNCFKNTATDKAEGNCVTVAFIKAAIGTFGVNNVFRSVTREDDKKQYSIMLRNGDILLLGFDEMETAKKLSPLKAGNTDLLSADITKYAQMCYAAMAKKLQKSVGYITYAAALVDLNDGYPVENIAALLGLTLKPIKPVTTKELMHYNHILVKNYYYTAYAYLGYYDEVRQPEGYAQLEDIRKYHSGTPCFIKRCSISEAYRVDE
jgi:hypothetical protein